MLKVTVTGYVNNVFVGTDEQVEKYLIDLKKQQESNIDSFDLKAYRKEMPPFKQDMLNSGTSKKFGSHHHRYTDHVDTYNKPTQFLKEFRETTNPFRLKIKIERVQDPSTNFF